MTFRPCALIFALAICGVAHAQGAQERFVSAGKDLHADGTTDRPFRTIQRCVEASSPGDTCTVRPGVYRERVVARQGVTVRGTSKKSVVVTGLDVLRGWSRYRGSIYRRHVALNPELLANQLFVDGTPQVLAQWPNGGSDLMNPTWAQMGEGTTTTSIHGSEAPQVDLVGAKVRFAAGSNAFAQQTTTVTHAAAGTLDTDFSNIVTCPHLCFATGGKYYLFGKLSLLDAPGEWFYDSAKQNLYFWPHSLSDLQHTSVKQREVGVDLKNVSGVRIETLTLIAASIHVDATSSGNTIDDIDVSYLSHFDTLTQPDPSKLKATEAGWDIVASHEDETGLLIDGEHNTLENSEIRLAAGNGVRLRGSYNTLRNNLIHDAGYGGSYATAISVSGNHQLITHNTLYNTLRDAITVDFHVAGRSLKDSEISYNDLSHTALQSTDSAAIYICCELNGAGTVIHHNAVHDVRALETIYHPAGIYIDNGSGDFQITNNILWNIPGAAIQVHGDGHNSRNMVIENNTVEAGGLHAIWFINTKDVTGSTIQNNRVFTPPSFRDVPQQSTMKISNNSPSAPGASNDVQTAGCHLPACPVLVLPASY